MCVAIYWDLCKSYMNIPFKIVTIITDIASGWKYERVSDAMK